MAKIPQHFKFSGIVSPHNTLHQISEHDLEDPSLICRQPDEHYIGPTMIRVDITTPKPKTIFVPKYKATAKGTSLEYAPSKNCKGYFMSSLYQPNNNCYNYACNIATNTFAQPGRKSGYQITEVKGATIESYAKEDGLILVTDSKGHDIKTAANLSHFAPPPNSAKGHFVALLISDPGDENWPGDYHWVRCDIPHDSKTNDNKAKDNNTTTYGKWSQKDGIDQVTDFDFAGKKIVDPSSAKCTWTVNQGPVKPPNPPLHMHSSSPDLVVSYIFRCFMFVPDNASFSII